jgi:hypothetical protein
MCLLFIHLLTEIAILSFIMKYKNSNLIDIKTDVIIFEDL